MNRKVICPHCGMSSEFEGRSELHCWACAKDFTVEECDFQDVNFVESNDGYHSWQSQPTAYHTIYICRNYPQKCGNCTYRNKTFCFEGKIDIRMPVNAVIGQPGELR
ncbi:MAG: hypothetical protein PHY23_11255 [Oscillospiraceae bacterium]|nr:hypothetical protein [Oscillospiraceae bacterium]